jgi:thioester reductase-like protein
MTLARFPERVFLTGATGVLGARILKDLLVSTGARIHCLARGTKDQSAEQRVRAVLEVYDTERALESAFNARVTVLAGDVTQERLGLGEAEYARLQQATDLTIHAAANTSLLATYKRLEPINVGGTRRVIDFCLGTAGRNLSYVSTCTVMGDKTFDEQVRFAESDYDLGQGFEYMNYQRSKFCAEALVRKAQEHGLRWRIFRPGQIHGDSVTGAYPHAVTQATGLFYDLFKTAMETQVMPEAYLHYDVVPVDYVSRGLIALAAGDEFFEVYHLLNPDVKSFAEVMGLLREAGYAIDLVPEETYKQRLRHGEIRKNGAPYRSAILKAFTLWYFISKVSFYRSALTECRSTSARLQQLGVSCAPIDARLIGTYVRAGIREGYFPSPPARESASVPPTPAFAHVRQRTPRPVA